MKAFRREYEASTGIERHRYRLAALAACGPLEPGVAYIPTTACRDGCTRPYASRRPTSCGKWSPTSTWVRWLMVREGKRQKRQGAGAREVAGKGIDVAASAQIRQRKARGHELGWWRRNDEEELRPRSAHPASTRVTLRGLMLPR